MDPSSSTIVLEEFKDSEPIGLTPDERDALRSLVPEMSIRAEAGHEDLFVLNPRGTVGAVQVGEKRFELRPKIKISRFAFVLAYSMDPEHWHQNGFNFEEDDDLFEAVIPGFVLQLERALRGGPLYGYRPEEDALPTVRGRIRFDEQLRARFGISPPIECRFDEFTDDVEINRILKAAIERLARIRIRRPESRRRLRALLPAFATVASVTYDPRNVPEIHWTRLTERFRPVTEFARLILRSRSLEFRGGRVAGAAFLLDLSEVFENFVVVALREALELPERQFPQQARGRPLYLDEERDLKLKPDLSWWDDTRCLFVGDAKYKRTPAETGVKHPDIYQLLAYTTATRLSHGMLIYAAGEEDQRTYSIPFAGKHLQVRTLDLDQPPDKVLAEIEVVAARVRQLAEIATGDAVDNVAASQSALLGDLSEAANN
jgi:5-methylcytosine-specific restriction enzyme subunit McrC